MLDSDLTGLNKSNKRELILHGGVLRMLREAAL